MVFLSGRIISPQQSLWPKKNPLHHFSNNPPIESFDKLSLALLAHPSSPIRVGWTEKTSASFSNTNFIVFLVPLLPPLLTFPIAFARLFTCSSFKNGRQKLSSRIQNFEMSSVQHVHSRHWRRWPLWRWDGGSLWNGNQCAWNLNMSQWTFFCHHNLKLCSF